jgi:hypothetical protein
LVVETPDVSRSSAEAEYHVVAHAIAECCELRQLLQELHDPLSKATLVFCDNVSAVYMAANPVHHRRTKHIEIDIHFVRKKVALGEVRVLHVPSSHQFDDIMTKGLPIQLFTDFRFSLGVCQDPPTTAGGCIECCIWSCIVLLVLQAVSGLYNERSPPSWVCGVCPIFYNLQAKHPNTQSINLTHGQYTKHKPDTWLILSNNIIHF